MGGLRRLVVSVAAVILVLGVRCQAAHPPYLVTISELDAALGDIGRAQPLLLPRGEGWDLTTSSVVVDVTGRAALLRIHGSTTRSAAEASASFRVAASRLGADPPAPTVGSLPTEMLDIRPPVARRSAPDATWRARLLRVDRYVALAEVSAPVDREISPDWEPTWGAVADAECEAILARVTALLRDKLLHATPQT